MSRRFDEQAVKFDAEPILSNEVGVTLLAASTRRTFCRSQIFNHDLKFGSGKTVVLHESLRPALTFAGPSVLEAHA